MRGNASEKTCMDGASRNTGLLFPGFHFIPSGLRLLVALASLFTGCSAESDSATSVVAIERQLSWVENVSPAAMLQEDTRVGRLRFLSVCGYSCRIPAVGAITAQRCYPSVEVQKIEGTTDALASDRHAALVRRAAEVADQYNTLVVQSAALQGRSLCPVGANWDAAFRDLHAVIRAAHPGLSEADFTLMPREPKFLVVLPQEVLSPRFEVSTCAVLRKHNLPLSAHIAVLGHLGQAELNARVMCNGTSGDRMRNAHEN